MSVTSWNFLAENTQGPMVAPDGTRTYTIEIEAFSDSADDSGITILSHSEFPRQFVSTHPNDPLAYCVAIKPKRHPDNAKYWTINYEYSTRVPQFAQANPATGAGPPAAGGAPSHDPDDPLSWAPELRWSTRMYREPRLWDFNGELFATTAGELLEPGQNEWPRLVLSIKRNLPTFDIDLLNRCPGGVNEAPMIGYTERTIKCERLDAEPRWDKDQFYWIVSGEFIFATGTHGTRFKDWQEWRLNAGYMRLESSNGELVPILERGGQRPPKPRPLNSTGTTIIDVANDVADLDDLHWLSFRVCPDAPLHVIGLFN